MTNTFPQYMLDDYQENYLFLKNTCLEFEPPNEYVAFRFEIELQHGIDVYLEGASGAITPWFNRTRDHNVQIGMRTAAIRRTKMLAAWIDNALDILKKIVNTIPITQRKDIIWEFSTGFSQTRSYYVDVNRKVRVMPKMNPLCLSSIVVKSHVEVILLELCPSSIEYLRKDRKEILFPGYLKAGDKETSAFMVNALNAVNENLELLAKTPSLYDDHIIEDMMIRGDKKIFFEIDRILRSIKAVLLRHNIDLDCVGLFNLGKIGEIEAVDMLKNLKLNRKMTILLPFECNAVHQYLRIIGALLMRALNWGEELDVGINGLGLDPYSNYKCRSLKLYGQKPEWAHNPFPMFGTFSSYILPVRCDTEARIDAHYKEFCSEYYYMHLEHFQAESANYTNPALAD